MRSYKPTRSDFGINGFILKEGYKIVMNEFSCFSKASKQNHAKVLSSTSTKKLENTIYLRLEVKKYGKWDIESYKSCGDNGDNWKYTNCEDMRYEIYTSSGDNQKPRLVVKHLYQKWLFNSVNKSLLDNFWNNFRDFISPGGSF